jgi:hypothetical protein
MSDANVENRPSRNLPSIALTASKLLKRDRRFLTLPEKLKARVANMPSW